MNGDYTNIASYRVSGYSSPGEPNSTENENFINNLKNGVINKFGDFEIRVVKNQTEGNTDAEIEVELTGDLDPEKKWEIYVDDEKIDNPNKDKPLIITNLSGGTKIIRLEIWNEELEQFCPFEKAIEIPVDKTEEEEICKGECITLISEGENCVAWIDEDGNVLSHDQEYEVCPEKYTVITELIENAEGLVIKKIIHHINVKSGNYSLYTEIPDCPAYEVILMVNGQNIDITWFDGTNEPKKTVTSSGEYTVSITDNDNGCTYDEVFSVSNDIFMDSDGDGVCDNEDCNPNDNTKTYKIGDPCDDGLPCTVNDKYDSDCNCTGETPKYGLAVAITGDNNICYYQTSTTLTVDANGGTEPYEILWSTGETTESIEIKEVSQSGGDVYTVTVTDASGCIQEESIELIRYDSDDTDGDGYCDDVDCAPYSAEIGGPGSPCDDGDPSTIHDVHDENCNCAGVPNPCKTDLDGDGICDECKDESGDPNGLVPPCPERDCNDFDPAIGSVGSPCDDGDPNTINDRMNEECECVGEFDQSKCTGSVTIDIYDGLNDKGNPGTWGGEKVFGGGRDKWDDGALTLANLNDTDGDGDKDGDGIPEILDINDDEVVHSQYGRDEVDLMKLEIKPSGYNSNCKVKIEYKGDIAFYNKYTKGPKIKNLEFDATKSTTVWVEARAVSKKMKDIEIFAKVGGKEMDRVSATAIWVDYSKAYYKETSKKPNPLPGVFGLGIDDINLLNSIEKSLLQVNHGFRAKDKTRYGFGTCAERTIFPFYANKDFYFAGRVLFEFKIEPIDIIPNLNKYKITFDIARRKHVYDLLYDYGYYFPEKRKNQSPEKNEEADDDPQDPNFPDEIDEDDIPYNSEIFSFDAPSTPINVGKKLNSQNQLVPAPVNAIAIRNDWFEEYARIVFKNGQNIKGNKTSGSRCSKKVKWSFKNALACLGSNNESTHPFANNYQNMEKVNAGDIVITRPRFVWSGSTPEIEGNGDINISPNQTGIDENYLLRCIGNEFKLYIGAHTNAESWIFLCKASQINGKWNLSHPKLSIEIIDGTTPFTHNQNFVFWIKEIPKNVENNLKVIN
ncbi:MAG TPA: hypothetical protein ENK91_12780 [Bacteroidetes bacterium]|nr:hypothetical protein [Bacteroidota bacterium]